MRSLLGANGLAPNDGGQSCVDGERVESAPHATAEIQHQVVIRVHANRLVIGPGSQINPFTVIYQHEPITIGANVMVGPQCMFASGNHDYRQTGVAMRFAGNTSCGPIITEDDVWIGAQCIILSGVRIGTGAVVAAGTLVTRDVPPFAVVGNSEPIKTIRMRK